MSKGMDEKQLVDAITDIKLFLLNREPHPNDDPLRATLYEYQVALKALRKKAKSAPANS